MHTLSANYYCFHYCWPIRNLGWRCWLNCVFCSCIYWVIPNLGFQMCCTAGYSDGPNFTIALHWPSLHSSLDGLRWRRLPAMWRCCCYCVWCSAVAVVEACGYFAMWSADLWLMEALQGESDPARRLKTDLKNDVYSVYCVRMWVCCWRGCFCLWCFVEVIRAAAVRCALAASLAPSDVWFNRATMPWIRMGSHPVVQTGNVLGSESRPWFVWRPTCSGQRKQRQ